MPCQKSGLIVTHRYCAFNPLNVHLLEDERMETVQTKNAKS